MRDLFRSENLSHDAIHGYIAFVSNVELPPGEVAEREIIDHPWLQRLRQIHQLQTAWWVFPTAEHTRFQHVLGVMHLASKVIERLYPSLKQVCPDVPSRGYVESLLRMAGLLHDVGHGPFGHFLDEHFLKGHGLTHETLGAIIIQQELGDLLRRIRRNPNSELEPQETLDPLQIAQLITRPKGSASAEPLPKWLRLLRSLFSGIYTVDNMDFVLRDAYMSGYSQRAFDLERLLRYSQFSDSGLTLHRKGMGALLNFMEMRASLFRTIYFHRTVRAIDLTLADLFEQSKPWLFPGNPAEHLAEYRRFTEWSLLIEVTHWQHAADPQKRALGERWQRLVDRQSEWRMMCERNLLFERANQEQTSLLGRADYMEQALREKLPPELQAIPLRVDLPRLIQRPHTLGPAEGQNFLYDDASGKIGPLTNDQLYRHLPTSHRICRVYAPDTQHRAAIVAAFDALLGGAAADDLTNM